MPARALSVKTPLGDGALLFRRMTAHEPIGRPFEFIVDLLSENLEVSAKELLGKPMTVNLEMEDGSVRHFNGLVTRFTHLGWEGDHALYQAVLRPWLWFLTRTSDCRIFPDKNKADKLTTPEIVKEVFRLNGFTDFEDALSESAYFEWEFCVQYRETAFNFVQRLMEQAGIYYYFKHEEDKHTLVLADAVGGHSANQWCKNLPYRIEAASSASAEQHVSNWTLHHEAQPGAVAMRDWDFEDPQGDRLVTETKSQGTEHGDTEVYDYPGEYVQNSDGSEYARVRMEEIVARFERVRGVTNARGMATGTLFNLYRHPRDDQNREYLVLGTTIVVQSEEYGSGASKDEFIFKCSFEAIDSQITYHPPRTSPKPVIQGPQTAVVVGPAGKKYWTDKYLRVMVQFPWDRYNKKDDKSSPWIRVSQFWAGPQWGSQHLPHIGQEVIVQYEEGDPDCPIIVGRVYNADNMPMLDVPANETQSGYRDHGNNEDVWEGDPGKQWMHRKQECGNEFKMDGTSGAEKIELRDKYGNEMVMDAVAGTILIRSPTHESKMTLGKSIELETASNWINNITGNWASKILGEENKEIVGPCKIKVGADVMEVFIGANHKTTLGFVSSLIALWKQETIIGAETKFIKGAKVEFTNGIRVSHHKGTEYTQNPDHKGKHNGIVFSVAKAIAQYPNKWVLEAKAAVSTKCSEWNLSKAQKASLQAAKFEGRTDWWGLRCKDVALEQMTSFVGKSTSWDQKADDYKCKANTDFNSGTLKIKK